MKTPIRNDLEGFLLFLQQIEYELQSGASVDEVRSKYELSMEQYDQLVDRFCVPPNACETLSACALKDAVVPIFYAKAEKENVKQCACGVLLKIARSTFLLTAAHVTDHLTSGYLLVPGVRGMTGIGGDVSHWKPSDGETRESDKIDIAYVRLSKTCRNSLDRSFQPMTLDDICFSRTVASIPFATFVGYPGTKGKRQGNLLQSERITYTGHMWTQDLYDLHGYSQEQHICVRMRRKKTFSSLYGRKLVAPFPTGISGGAILSWPSKYQARLNGPRLKLVGIPHLYSESAHCLVGTHIQIFLNAIVFNMPHLRTIIQRAIDRVENSEGSENSERSGVNYSAGLKGEDVDSPIKGELMGRGRINGGRINGT
jgi:hypothetical protein